MIWILPIQVIWKASGWSESVWKIWKVSRKPERRVDDLQRVWMISKVSGWTKKCPENLAVRKVLLFFTLSRSQSQKSHFLSLQNGSGGLGSREFWSRVSFPGSLFLGSVVQSPMVVWSKVSCSSYAFSIIWLWSNHHRFQCWHPDYSIFLEFCIYIVKLIKLVLVPRFWLASLLS